MVHSTSIEDDFLDWEFLLGGIVQVYNTGGGTGKSVKVINKDSTSIKQTAGRYRIIKTQIPIIASRYNGHMELQHYLEAGVRL